MKQPHHNEPRDWLNLDAAARSVGISTESAEEVARIYSVPGRRHGTLVLLDGKSFYAAARQFAEQEATLANS
jgi:hypothetical protein